jgi:hypothetical protein
MPKPEPMNQSATSLQKFIIDDTNDREQDEKAIEELTEANSTLHE